jgi:hypothetical protein
MHKSVQCKGLFSDRQEKSRKPKLKKYVRRVGLSEDVDELCIERTKICSMSRACEVVPVHCL